MDKNNNVKNNLKFICIFFVTLFISFICIVKSFTTPKEDMKMLYAYNINRNTDYKVYLRKNNFIDQEYMGMNSTYITDLVDYIDANFRYNYNVSQKATSKSTYKIIAVINVEYYVTGSSQGTKLWSKEYTLLEPKQIATDTNQININENVKIDFNKYNTEIKNFKEQFGLPIKSYLEVKLVVNSEASVKGSGKTEKDNSVVNLKMDLNGQVFNITQDYEPVSKGQILDESKIGEKSNIILLIIGIILFLISIIGILNIFRKIISVDRKTDYEVALNRILKNYGDIVAEIVTPTETEEMKVIDVKNFDQLLDIEEEIRMPILFYETIEGEEGEFTIIYDNIVYRYILSGRKHSHE